ncbi:GNAT family N-acetyltransferase [Shewanella sp. GXUN23E]|uniref:GNAT family N-acetyltransferase n=1 Tax=Shewanella sp. GXUN23E TaxID=3422498 RepID=UPI003D7E5C30
MDIVIRKWRQADAAVLRVLFEQTVLRVNCRDYHPQQLVAWVNPDMTADEWLQRIQAISPYVACVGEQILGYADVQADGLIDHFFVHHEYQRQGVGQVLMQHLHLQAETAEIGRLYAHVSLTAKAFFEYAGFRVIDARIVHIRGQQLDNFLMEKPLLR